MSGKLFGQIVALIIIASLVFMSMKCVMKKCPIMGKYMKSCCHGMQKTK